MIGQSNIKKSSNIRQLYATKSMRRVSNEEWGTIWFSLCLC